jgi:hypothetical protein
VVLVDTVFLQGSIVYAAFVGMQILAIHLCVTVSISDMKPRSIRTAPNRKTHVQQLMIQQKEMEDNCIDLEYTVCDQVVICAYGLAEVQMIKIRISQRFNLHNI